MADAFSSRLNEISAPGGPASGPRSAFGSGTLVKDVTVGPALAGAGQLLEGVAALGSFIAGKETDKQLDTAIGGAVDKALGFDASGDINISLDRLAKMKEAARQGGDQQSFDRFNLSLHSDIKSLKARNPERIAEIDERLRKRNIVDPGIALVKDQIDREKTAEETRTAQQNTIISTAITNGYAVYQDDDPSKPVDRQSTLLAMDKLARNAAAINSSMSNIGYKLDASGKATGMPSGMRSGYLLGRGELIGEQHKEIIGGLTPIVNTLKDAINKGAKPEELKALGMAANQKAIDYRNNVLDRARLMGLSKEETDDLLAATDRTLIPIMQMALPIKDAGDLSAAKNVTSVLEVLKSNSELASWERAPNTMAFYASVPKEVAAAVTTRTIQSGSKEFDAAFKNILSDIGNLGGIVKPIGSPKSPDGTIFKEAPTADKGLSDKTKADRAMFSVQATQAFIDKVGSVSTDKDAESFIRVQIPTIALAEGHGDKPLTKEDVSTLVSQYNSPAYFAHMKATKRYFPEDGAALERHVFNIVQRDNMNKLKDLSNNNVGIEWDSESKKFIPSVTSISELEGGTPVLMPNDKRLIDAVNKNFATILSLKDTSEVYSKMSEAGIASQYINDTSTKFGTAPTSDKGGIDFSSMTPGQQEKWKQDQIASAELGPKGFAKMVSDALGKGFREPRMPKEPIKEAAQEDFQIGPIDLKEDKLNDIVKAFENRQLVGKGDDGLWKPHSAIEGGRPNIGYGHKLTKDELAGEYVLIDGAKVSYKDGLSDSQIETLLQQDLKIANTFVNKEFNWLKPKQKDAISSLIYNVGVSEFKSSKAYKHLKEGATLDFVKEAFDKPKGYVYINKKFSPGLAKRRALEKEMFLTGE